MWASPVACVPPGSSWAAPRRYPFAAGYNYVRPNGAASLAVIVAIYVWVCGCIDGWVDALVGVWID